MERLIYRSRAGESVGARDVFDIVETSARRNSAREITGFLLYDEDRFLQLIEGPAGKIEELIEDLNRDPRHHSIEILNREAARERLFSDWEMKRLITFADVPAMEAIRANLAGKPEADGIMEIVTEFLEAPAG